MSDPGLNYRLKQRSRRSGFMVGLTMALTLMVCVGGFTVIYAQIEPLVSDFVSKTNEPTATAQPRDVAQAQPTQQPSQGNIEQVKPTEPPAATQAPTPRPSATPSTFKPDYQIDSANSVNLRAGPGVNQYDVVTAVPIDAPLMYLKEDRASADPAGDGLSEGQKWMKFRTEDGEEGWIREVDVTEYKP